jgi:hypothetical protein
LDDGDEADWIVKYMDVPINQSLQEGRRPQQVRGVHAEEDDVLGGGDK